MTAAAAAMEVLARLVADEELLDTRADALIYGSTGLLLGAAAGLLGGIPAALLLAPRIGAKTAALWPAASLTLALPLAHGLTGLAGRVPASWIALTAGAVVGAGLLLLARRRVSEGQQASNVGEGHWSWGMILAVLLILGVQGWLGARLWSGERLAPGEAPNLVLITVDTLRADAVEGFREGRDLPAGLERARTHALDRLGDSAVRFTQASTPIPKTPQAISSLMTGLYPEGHGVTDLFSTLDGSFTTLAERLRRAGWSTGAVVANMLIGRGSGISQGFDRFHDKDGLRPYIKQLALVDLGLRMWPRAGQWLLNRFPELRIGKETAGEMTDRALRMAGFLSDRPFFLWIHYLDPHWPYEPPDPYRSAVDTRPGKPLTIYDQIRDGDLLIGDLIHHNNLSPAENERLRALYAGETQYVDREIGRLLDGLAGREGPRGTVLALTADHGESLGEHGYYFSHGDLVHEPSMRVPLIVRLPGGPEGLSVPVPVSLVDLHPTLLQILGQERGGRLDGRSFADLMGASVPVVDHGGTLIYGESDLSYLEENPHLTIPGESGKMRFVRSGRYKLVRTPRNHDRARRIDPELGAHEDRTAAFGFEERTRLGESGEDLVRLYDLRADPLETADISSKRPVLTAALSRALDAWLMESARQEGPREARRGSRKLLKTIRALGYVDKAAQP